MHLNPVTAQAVRLQHIKPVAHLGFEFLPPVPGENHWLSVMLCDDSASRDRLVEAFAAENIEVRPVWKPLHLQPVFKDVKMYGGKVAEDLFARGLCLPSGTGLSSRDLERIAGVICQVSRI